MVVHELLWFLQGRTDAKVLQEKNVNIWNGNTTREFLEKRGLPYEEGDIGPMYGFQWRHFGAPYTGCNSDYSGRGIDQLTNVIDLLRSDPYSRRILMTTVNVSDLEKGCLHPCHGIVVQFYVSDDSTGNKRLSCHMYQRSVDTFLGLTWNIFSYAVLTHIIAAKVDMQPHELIISTGDTHLYVDHVEQAVTQLKRTPYPSPQLWLKKDVASKRFEDLMIDDFEIVGYLHHPAIKAKMSV
jgi:thymidylate synthase